MNKKVILMALILVVGLFPITTADGSDSTLSIGSSYTCFMPKTLSDNTSESIYHDGEDRLQKVLNDAGYNIDVDDDQTNIQIWEAEDNVKLKVTFIKTISAYRHVFGYYTDEEADNFEKIFDNVNSSEGSSFVVNLNKGDKIGFGADVIDKSNFISTENSLNTNEEDMIVVYDLGDEFILAFEDWVDYDYQDLVVSIKVLSCGDEEEQEPICGDADEDGFLTATDLGYFIDYLYFHNSTIPKGFVVDINNDGKFNQLDIDYLVNHLFFGGPAPICEYHQKSKGSSNGPRIVDLTGGSFCQPDWQCSGWSECAGGTQTRTCEDSNFCHYQYNQPIEKRGCEIPVYEEVFVPEEKSNNWWIFLITAILVLIIIVLLVNFLG